ncbi:MAG: hypothetical protein ACI8Q3_002107 [Marinomonas primoryensis]|jgi:hypothetical protein
MLPHFFSESTKGSKVSHKSLKANVSSCLRLACRSLLAVGVLFSVAVCAASTPVQPKEGEAFSYAGSKGHAR